MADTRCFCHKMDTTYGLCQHCTRQAVEARSEDANTDRIAALIAAGDKLAEYARHDWTCRAPMVPNCTCAYTEAAKAWKELTK